jgi:hypothetical protein
VSLTRFNKYANNTKSKQTVVCIYHKHEKNRYKNVVTGFETRNALICQKAISHLCRIVPCHHGMARSQVADRVDSLQIWKVAANISNKQSRTADRGWTYNLGVGRGANNPHRKTPNLLCNVLRRIAGGLL